MGSNRREFFLGSPLCLLGLMEGLAGSDELDAAIAAMTPSDPAALDFWTRGMGISHGAIPTSEAITRGAKAQPAGPETSDFAREPIFLHYHEGEKSLIQVSQFQKKDLLDSGDTQVDLQLQRLRLNGPDEVHFARYTSGGIYLEMQQGQPAAASTTSGTDTVAQVASSLFSAFFPAGGGSKGKEAGSSKSGKKGGNNFLQSGAASGGAKAGAPVPLQSAKQAQTLALPNGFGKAAFSSFVKDPRQSFFGSFISAVAGATSSPVYTQLLSVPSMFTPALTAIRGIVANLQLHGGNQQILMQSPPIDIAATAAALDQSSNPLPLRQGSYIAFPREQAALIKDQLSKYKIMNGFLVPTEAQDLDISPEMVSTLLPGLSYLSVGVGVKKTKINSCSAGTKASG
jgi:hypothetical protein